MGRVCVCECVCVSVGSLGGMNSLNEKNIDITNICPREESAHREGEGSGVNPNIVITEQTSRRKKENEGENKESQIS